MPAAVTRTSTPPSSLTAVATIASLSAGLDVSTLANAARRPIASISPTVFLPCSSRMSATSTSAPSSARRRQHARPIPLPPPVTIATLPSRPRIGGLLGRHLAGELVHVEVVAPGGDLAVAHLEHSH